MGGGAEGAIADLEALLSGSAEGWGPAGALLATVDQSLRIVSSVFLDSATRTPRGPIAPGRRLAELFPADPLRSIVAPHIAQALGGSASEVDVGWEDPDALRIRLSFLPRFQGPGRQRGFFIIARNVAEIERDARAVDALRGRLAAVFDNAADAILMIGQDGRIEEASGAVATVFGWPPNELVGRPVSVLMDDQDREAHQGHLDRYAATGRSGILNVGPRKLSARRRDGEIFWMELSVGEAWIGGERKFVGVCRDITDRQRQEAALRRANTELEDKVFELRRLSADLEAQRKRSDELARTAVAARRQAEEASRAKSRFLATVSHELRTPLNGVLAVTDLLATRELPGEAGELVDIIRRSGRDLLMLLNEVLDLSKIEAGGLTLRSSPFSPAELVESLADVWSLAAKAKGLELQVETHGLPDRVIGDAGRLRQVLSNLLNNAIKFTSKGHVRLSATAETLSPGSAALTIMVSDTGPGLESAVRDRLFEPFVQGVSDHSRLHGGAGLGLAICRELVSLMGGLIFADEPESGGALMVIEVELPLATAAPAAIPSHAEPMMTGADLKVLVAEDHPVNRQVIGLLLQQIGVEPVMVEDGEAAVVAAAAEPFDVILMDVRMPRMDGLTATRRIRAGQGPNVATPVVAVTADAMAGDESGILDAGADGFLPKPITLAALVEAIDAALAGRSQAA